jgi:hypothetical protein
MFVVDAYQAHCQEPLEQQHLHLSHQLLEQEIPFALVLISFPSLFCFNRLVTVTGDDVLSLPLFFKSFEIIAVVLMRILSSN